MRKIDSELHARLATLMSVMGYELVGVEMASQGRGAIFRVYIDTPKGVTVDNCSEVSRQISAMFDVEGPVQGQYTLEVSSPGIDRPLFNIEQFRQRIGQRIKLKLYTPLSGRRQFQGKLLRVEGEDIYLLAELDGVQQELQLPFASIEKANLLADIKL